MRKTHGSESHKCKLQAAIFLLCFLVFEISVSSQSYHGHVMIAYSKIVISSSGKYFFFLLGFMPCPGFFCFVLFCFVFVCLGFLFLFYWFIIRLLNVYWVCHARELTRRWEELLIFSGHLMDHYISSSHKMSHTHFEQTFCTGKKQRTKTQKQQNKHWTHFAKSKAQMM